ncbi:hypothetical protein CYMTET_30643, partial [Cymbomonas tetramitiformis]
WDKIRGSTHYQKDPSRRLVRREGVARTLTSSYKQGFHMYTEFVEPKGGVGPQAPPRFFTPREVARLMGFPESFSLDACRHTNRAYHQLGNAVCPPIIAAIGGCLKRALELRSARSGCDHAGSAPSPQGVSTSVIEGSATQ